MPERSAPSVTVERLKRRSDFRAVADGMRTSGRAFVLQARRGEGSAVRVGFTVSRQVGNAVERNRVRRRLREMVRMSTALGSEGLCSGHDYVLVGKRAALTAPFGEMIRDLTVALRRVHPQAAVEGRSSGRPGTGTVRQDPLHEASSPSAAATPGSRRQVPRQRREPRPQER